MSGSVKRKYVSSRRTEQAAETRRRILATARELFVTQGYGRTTLTQIAAGAGVAVETVYAAFRTKAALLRQVWYLDFRGDEEKVTLYDRPEMQAILAEPDLTERIRRHAAFVTATNRRMAPLLSAIVGAATSEPGAQEMLAEWADRRLDVATKYAHAAKQTGQLAGPEDVFRDVVFATMDGALWERLVGERGWTDDQYAHWLAGFWTEQFVKKSPDDRRPNPPRRS